MNATQATDTTQRHYSIMDRSGNVIGCVRTNSRKRLGVLIRSVETVRGTVEQSDRAECPFCSEEMD